VTLELLEDFRSCEFMLGVVFVCLCCVFVGVVVFGES
jgi:hypothetical protein